VTYLPPKLTGEKKVFIKAADEEMKIKLPGK
jgi:hypothetical protein